MMTTLGNNSARRKGNESNRENNNTQDTLLESIILGDSYKKQRRQSGDMRESAIRRQIERDQELSRIAANQYEHTFVSKEVEPVQVGVRRKSQQFVPSIARLIKQQKIGFVHWELTSPMVKEDPLTRGRRWERGCRTEGVENRDTEMFYLTESD